MTLTDYALEIEKLKAEAEYRKALLEAKPHTYIPTPTGIGVGMAPFGPATTAPPPPSSTYYWTAPPAQSHTALFLGTVCGGSLTIAVFGNIPDNSFDIFITHPSHTEAPWTLHLQHEGVCDGRGVVDAVDYAVDCYLYANEHIAAELGIPVAVPEPWPTHPTGYTHVTYGAAITSWASVPSAAASRSR